MANAEPSDQRTLSLDNDFQQEIDRMNASPALQALLAEREKEVGAIPIEAIRGRLEYRSEKSSLP